MRTVYAKKTVCTFSKERRCWCDGHEATEVFIVQKCAEQEAVIFRGATDTYANASLCVEWSLKYANAVIKRMYLPLCLCAATGALHMNATESVLQKIAGLRADSRQQHHSVGYLFKIMTHYNQSSYIAQRQRGKGDRKVSNPHFMPNP